MTAPRTRPLAALLAVTVAVMASGPSLAYACAMELGEAAAAPPCHEVPPPPCHGDAGTDADGALSCCFISPMAPAEGAVAAPDAPRTTAAPLVATAPVSTALAARAPRPPAGAGPPPLPVRPHLALSVLLI